MRSHAGSIVLIPLNFLPAPPVKDTKPDSAPASRSHLVAIAVIVVLAIAPAIAADLSTLDGWRTLFPTHAGWTVLATIGLLAVAVAALSVRRPRVDKPLVDDAPLGRMQETAPVVALPVRNDAGAMSPIARASDAPSIATDEPVVRSTAFVTPIATLDAEPEPQVEAMPLPVHSPSSGSTNGSQLFLALQHVDLSIDVLRRHLQREPRPMPAVWLMLLDLCRTHGREQAFQELAIEFHRRFNVCTPEWEGFPPGRDDPGLEAYPRLIKEITLAWGTHECRRLLERLLYDNRGAQRKGFTLNAYNDLIALRRAADAVLDSIEKDATQDRATESSTLDAMIAARAATSAAPSSALVSDLESQLESDLRADSAPQSAIEREHPALAGMIAREWGNAAMTARLCDMLARGGDSTHALSVEASEELELLRALAQRLSAQNGIVVANGEAA